LKDDAGLINISAFLYTDFFNDQINSHHPSITDSVDFSKPQRSGESKRRIIIRWGNGGKNSYPARKRIGENFVDEKIGKEGLGTVGIDMHIDAIRCPVVVQSSCTEIVEHYAATVSTWAVVDLLPQVGDLCRGRSTDSPHR
jgi:hypothetical protein